MDPQIKSVFVLCRADGKTDFYNDNVVHYG